MLLIYFFCIIGLLAPSALGTPTPSTNSEIRNIFERQSFCTAHNNQLATWYDHGTNPQGITACGTQFDPQGPTVAISTAVPNYKSYCGRQMLITSNDQSAAVIVTISDANATGDLGEFALDLTVAVFDILSPSPTTSSQTGEVNIDWVLLGGGPCI